MIFGTAGNYFIAARDDGFGHGLCVLHDLFLIIGEFRFQCFLEGDGFGSNHVHQWATLCTRKYQRLEFLFKRFIGFRQNNAATWATQRFMCGRSHYVGMRNRIGINTGSHQTGNVCHVNKEISADRFCDRRHAFPIDNLRIGGETSDDHFWFVFVRQGLNFIVINQTGIGINAVLNRIENLSAEIHFCAVGQMTTMRQAHAEHRIARSQQG